MLAMAEYIEREALREEIKIAQEGLESDNDIVWEMNKKCFAGLAWAHRLVLDAPAADVALVVRCRECKRRNKQQCPLVMVRFDMKPNGKMKKVLEQNYVDDEFWCKDGAKMDGE